MQGALGTIATYDIEMANGIISLDVGKALGFGSIDLIVKVTEKQILDALIAKYGPTSIIGEIAKIAEGALPAAPPAA